VQGITHSLEILFLISIVLHVAGGQDVVLGEMLSRPYPAGAMMTAAITYTNEKHGTVPSVYIKCLQDKVIVPEVQDFLIELNQISQVVEMESDHSPMLSAPEKLHQILLATADKYA
jgi:pimeloyl-ACP methyl ester carboxylesterase